jgi:type VI secretion system protein ImpE
MPTARELYAAGQLESAIDALGAELRSNPLDTQRRTFLFELLSFAGEYDRAEKQLDVLARAGVDAELAVLPYRAAVQAERTREQMFASGELPTTTAPEPVAGTLNGRPFSRIEDADPRVGARLEVMAGGRYLWIPFAHLAAVQVDAPRMLRDLRWAPARLRTGSGVPETDLGEVLLPALSPAAWRSGDADVRLGRVADWEELPDGSFAPLGQKLLRVDDALVPLLDVRELVLAPARSEALAS